MKKEYSKAKKMLHPNSRKSNAIARRAQKISNKEKAKMAGLIKQNLIGEKMMWLKENMLPDICPYTPELTADLLNAYISRNDKEIEQIDIKRSIGGKRNRQHASREDVIKMTKERDQQEYDSCGIEIPDILIVSQCKMLQKWNGELNLLPNFKFRRFGKKHLNLESQKVNKSIKELKKKNLQFTNHGMDSNAETAENENSQTCAMEIE